MLKRLSDAVRDGDEVLRSFVALAVHPMAVQSIGTRSAANQPLPVRTIEGHALSVELVEAGGTHQGKSATELSTLGRLWTDIEAGDNVAGAPSRAKLTPAAAWSSCSRSHGLASRHHPAQCRPKPQFQRWTTNPFRLIVDGRSRPEGHPRRAGVSVRLCDQLPRGARSHDPEVHTGTMRGGPLERVRQCRMHQRPPI